MSPECEVLLHDRADQEGTCYSGIFSLHGRCLQIYSRAHSRVQGQLFVQMTEKILNLPASAHANVHRSVLSAALLGL